tara:strand:- start:286 stop:531 length:246 start_codon:yes stop_codon:yes gene_type:complete
MNNYARSNWFLCGNSCDIIIVNTDTKNKYFHNRVPIEHVELLKGCPSLNVSIVGSYDGESYIMGSRKDPRNRNRFMKNKKR